MAHRIGADENGLGPRLGPLVVTAAWAEVDEKGARQLTRKLPAKMRRDLDDSKALMSCHDVSLGEAWARVIVRECWGLEPKTPGELFSALSLQEETALQANCPPSSQAQCWNTQAESFAASSEQLERISGQFQSLAERGIVVRGVLSDVTCTGELNRLKSIGVHRFAADLHSMERLVLRFREEAGAPVLATLGKVGGIGKYEPFFGPLAGRLHTALEEGQARSCYHFPTLGELRFVRDADASDLLVMLASLVGKYVRELLMKRISAFYREFLEDPELSPSGYHDPVTSSFVEQSRVARQRLRIVQDCFERRPAEKKAGGKKKSAKQTKARRNIAK